MEDFFERLKEMTILYAEDEEGIRKNVSDSLRYYCKEVLEAGNGEEAYTVYKEKQPNIILSDIHMPKLNGIELVKKIREEDTNTPIVMITAHTDKDYLLEAASLHMEKYIIKPVDLDELFETLEKCVEVLDLKQKIDDEKEEQEQMLIHQSRLASMGEMLANISHQWRQPLSRVSAMIMNMQVHVFDHYEKDEYLPQKLEDTQEQIIYMSNTIDDFINFYQKDKQKELFTVSRTIDSAINIVQSSMASYMLSIEKDYEEDFQLYAYPKELSQVILNLIHNAKDQCAIKNIEKPVLKIVLKDHQIMLEDNAGGIPEDLVEKIFEPYFTTKEEHKGTGLGLYMSRNILEKHFDAEIQAQNKDHGAQFIITFKKQDNN